MGRRSKAQIEADEKAELETVEKETVEEGKAQIDAEYPAFINIKSAFYCKELNIMIQRGNYKFNSKKEYDAVIKYVK